MSLVETITPSVIREWDSVNEQVIRKAPWSLASRISNDAGNDLESTLGEVIGITSSLNVNTTGYLLDATAGKILNDKFGGCNISYAEEKYTISNAANSASITI